ncbi:MAG: hypothetical protein V2I41_07040 [Pseudomonadales bacterium]|jgi:hypothetical protein|nr:hypothetical protein [Pseudomonadales bacterium]
MSESGLLHRWLARLVVITCAAVAIPVSADDYSAGWGPALGAQMPPIATPDQAGVERSLADLSGDQGLLLFLSRSADW